MLRRLQRACARARAGRPAIIFLVGASGLGKTSVVRRAIAGAHGLRVGLATGSADESGLPYALLSTALAQLAAGDLVPPAARGAEPPDARAARFYSVQRWLQGHPPPSLLALDDLQWADADSLDLLAFLVRRLADVPIAVVASLRPWPPGALEMAQGLVHAGLAELESLPPLSEAACGRLLARVAGGPLAQGVVQRAQALSAGNPLLIQEIARATRAGDAMPPLVGAGTATSLLLARFAGVPPPALRYAQVASVFGERFRPSLVPPVAGLDPGVATTALTALLRAGLVEPEAHGLVSFVHPLFREALYEDLPRPLRDALHAQALRALVAAGAEPEEAAAHAVAGELRGDRRAIAVLEAAGRAALATGGAGTAVIHLGRAVALAGTSNPPQRLILLSEALVAAGQPDGAIRAVERALADGAAAGAVRVAALRQLGRAAFVAGRLDLASQAFDGAAGAARHLDPVPHLEALLDAALTLMTADPIPRLLRRAEHARTLATAGTSVHRALADVAWGAAAAMSGDPRGVACVRATAAIAADLPVEHPDAAWMWRVHLACAAVARQVEAFDEALAIYERVAPPLDRLRAPMPITALAISHCDTLKRLGRLDEVERLLDRMTALVELAPTAAPWLELARLDLAQERGEPVAERAETLAASLGDGDRLRPLLRLWLWSVQGEDLARRGAPGAALPLFRHCRKLADRDGIVDPCTVPWTRSAVEAQIAAGRLDEAEDTLAWLTIHAEPWACHGPRAVIAYGRALVASRRGDGDAEPWFQRARAELEATTLPLLESRVLLALGRHRRHDRRAAAARPVLAAAARMAEHHGAHWLATAANAELHASGGRRRSRATDPDELTSQERRIAHLAAAGRSNGEIGSVLFLSPRTVESHLGRVYAKLRIASRRDLADRLADPDL